MKVGTKSLLFGVHNFIWHPFTVWLAWIYCYRSLPKWWETIAIFCHDFGYWGKPNMDGPEGQTHPELGARVAYGAVFRLAFTFTTRSQEHCRRLANCAHRLALGHSCHYAQKANRPVSQLWLADKASILFEPPIFYLTRAYLTGELQEYVANGPTGCSDYQWFQWYVNHVNKKVKQAI